MLGRVSNKLQERGRNARRRPPAPSLIHPVSLTALTRFAMTARTTVHGLQVATPLFRFIEDKVLPNTGVDSASFWAGFDKIVSDLAPKNATLLAERSRIQAEMNAWHTANPGPIKDMAVYRAH